MKSFNKNIKYGIYVAVLFFGLFLGYLIFGSSKSSVDSIDHSQHMVASSYTCSMHPSVVKDESGVCPICGMELVQVKTDNSSVTGNQFVMNERAIALANVQTSVIGLNSMNSQIVLSGEITLNEKTNATQTTLFDGRLDKLDVNFIGEYVRKGQRIGTIYSPELYLAQDKLLTSSSYKETHEKLYAAARNTLGLWKMTDKQIDDLLKSGKPIVNFPLVADVSGTVVEILASEGEYFKQGDPLFKVSRLYSVWAVFQAYENQLPLLKEGQEITISSEAFKGEPITAKISFIEPILDRGQRIVSVRADIENKNGKLKPGMFIEGLVKIDNKENHLVMVPKSAVLWTGENSVVYKKSIASKPIFEMKRVTLGEAVGDYYVVLNGLKLGDEVVTNGAFTIDAAAQLNGKKSMMYAMDTDSEQISSGHQNNIEISSELNDKLKSPLNLYFKLKNALVESDSENVENIASKLGEEFDSMNIDMLNEEVQLNIKAAIKSINSIKAKKSIDEKRLGFKSLSENFTFFVSHMTEYDNPIYIQHCPMADNNRGADWLSLEKAIKNPYFGDKMLTCGSVVNVLE